MPVLNGLARQQIDREKCGDQTRCAQIGFGKAQRQRMRQHVREDLRRLGEQRVYAVGFEALEVVTSSMKEVWFQRFANSAHLFRGHDVPEDDVTLLFILSVAIFERTSRKPWFELPTIHQYHFIFILSLHRRLSSPEIRNETTFSHYTEASPDFRPIRRRPATRYILGCTTPCWQAVVISRMIRSSGLVR